MITFEPLLKYMKDNNISMNRLIKTDVLSPSETTRIRSNHNFRLPFIDRLCKALNCQPGDIIKYIPDENTTDQKNG